jgi:ubiquinol-cytochrome c reductase cytochrome b subunit
MTAHVRWNKDFFLSVLNNHIIDYPTPINLSYLWSFGVTAAFCLGVQIVTGIFLAMHYTPHIESAFSSVEYIMRDVQNGWLVRYLHANGASMLFILIYSHMFRGLYYGSYMQPREYLWCSGVLIFLLMMATAFMGYVLPWGQMSLWGVTVITNLFSAIPFVGPAVVGWLWGGFSVGNATLTRFFSLHYLMPFAIAGLAVAHIALLHKDGSNNPVGVESNGDKIPFYPYFYFKDLFSVLVFIVFFSIFVFYFPNTLGHSDNYIPADPMLTPAHIVPEWYFLPFYAILRAVPNKLGGVLAMFSAVVILFFIPFINQSEVRSSSFRPLYKKVYWLLVADFLILGWVGQKGVDSPYTEIGQLATGFYFLFFLAILPGLGFLESAMMRAFISAH